MGRNRTVEWIFPKLFLVLPWPSFGLVWFKGVFVWVYHFGRKMRQKLGKIPLKSQGEHMLYSGVFLSGGPSPVLLILSPAEAVGCICKYCVWIQQANTTRYALPLCLGTWSSVPLREKLLGLYQHIYGFVGSKPYGVSIVFMVYLQFITENHAFSIKLKKKKFCSVRGFPLCIISSSGRFRDRTCTPSSLALPVAGRKSRAQRATREMRPAASTDRESLGF